MVAALAVFGLASMARGARPDVVIVGEGTDRKWTLSLHGLAVGGSEAEREFAEALHRNLNRSGWFVVTERPAAGVQVRGRCRVVDGVLDVTCEALNSATGKSYFSRVYRENPTQGRALAARVADAIVEAIKGVPGIASTRIALIGTVQARKDLYVIGADGDNLMQLTRDGVPCLSPAWSPDGRSLFYTSFVQGFPDVYRIDLESGRRSRVAAFPGINAGAQVSPDGRFIALALSKDGNPEIYTMELASGKLTRITRTPHAVEASPVWSPDGRQLAYVSDATGAPQIYVASRTGGAPDRITFRGSENVSPSWGPDGRIAYSSRRMGRYQICVYDPKTREETQLTADAVDSETPSWAPNGRHIACSRTEGYRAAVYILDTMGDPPVRLTSFGGDLYFPAWSPR